MLRWPIRAKRLGRFARNIPIHAKRGAPVQKELFENVAKRVRNYNMDPAGILCETIRDSRLGNAGLLR